MKKILIVDDQVGWLEFHSKAVHEILGADVSIDKAPSAQEGYAKLLENSKNPYNYLLTDLQMEDDYAPLLAGEWLVRQARNLLSSYKTKIIIISASPRIRQIAENYNVFYIKKSSAAVSIAIYKEFIN